MTFEYFGLRRTWSATLAIALLAWLVMYFVSGQIRYAIQRGNNLTELFDPYSEANGIRAGESYVDRGFTYNEGLPDVGYGMAFDNVGGKHDKNLCPSLPCIYLHYPPGPDLMIGAMTKMCGKGEIACIRIAPIAFGSLSLLALAVALVWAIGAERAAFVIGTFYFVPMVTNAMHNLHNHSYVTSLLFVYLALLLLLFVRPIAQQRIVLGGLFVIGFLYGWCSFDYAFHVALLPIPIWLLAEDWRARKRTVIWATGLACAGYALACLLHFWQVELFLGSWSAMFDDFRLRAAQRSSGAIEGPPMHLGRLLLLYWTQYLNEANYANSSFLAACASVVAVLCVRSERTVSSRFGIVWSPRPTYKWAFLVAFVIPNLWLVFMRQHATIHGHFLPRNFIVTYVVGALIVAMSFRRVPAAAPLAEGVAA